MNFSRSNIFSKSIYNLQERTVLVAIHFLLIAVICFPFDIYASDSNPGKRDITGQINISSNGNDYSLFAQQAKLSDILYELGKAADFELKLFENLGDEKLDWNYEAMNLIQLLENLLRNFNTVMLYEEISGKKQRDTKRKLKALWLIASDDSKPPAQLAPRNIEIELEQSETTTNQHQVLTAEQKFEISHIENLEGLTGDDVIETLKQTLLTEPDPVIRKRAVTALGDIGSTRILDALESGLGDNSSQVRTELAKTFASVKDQRSILALGQLSVGDRNAEVRQQAIRALSQHEGPAARAFIEAALKDKDNSVQQVARELLQ